MKQLEKVVIEKRLKTAQERPRYGMRKLSVGLVSCVLGYITFVSPQPVQAASVETTTPAIVAEVDKAEEPAATQSQDKKEVKTEATETSTNKGLTGVNEVSQPTGKGAGIEIEKPAIVVVEGPVEERQDEDKTQVKADSIQGASLEISPETTPQAQAASADGNQADNEGEKPAKIYKESAIAKDEKYITHGKGYRQSEIAGQGNKITITNENLGKEVEGIRVETLQPSPTSVDKKSYGVEVNFDKTKVDRTYNGFSITDSGRDKDINDSKSKFLNPGEVLPTNHDDKVTYQPDINNLDYNKGRQSKFEYNSTEIDRKHISNKDTVKTTIAWKGEYSKDNPNGKFLTGENFAVSVGINPYPNENKDLSLIEIEGNRTISKVPVKNQYIVSDAKIKNAGEEDYTRLIGEVYHPEEDILVEGAQALIVNGSNINELKIATGNHTLTIGQIVFKMPEGALQNKESIFNDNKFVGVQNLRAKFFARPRTAEEFSKLANSLKAYEDDTSSGYVSTGAGTKEITHNGEKIIIDKQGIARYDHYNLVGEMTINLDDTKHYEQTFNRIQSKEDTAYSNTLIPGGNITLKINSPSGKVDDPSKSYEDMENAKDNGLADGRIVEKFKKQAEAKGWKITTKPGKLSEFTVTAPKDARPGDTMYLPIEYKYTNGSKDCHSFYFVVKESNNVKPEYNAQVGYQGETLRNTPRVDLSDKADINNPSSYELVPGTYRDDKGNVWSDVTIDKGTGVVTAKVPSGEDVNIIGGENVSIPVKVNYVDKLTGEAKEEIVKAQFIARPKYFTTVTDTDEKLIPFETKEELDENLPAGEIKVITEGKTGKEKIVFEQDVFNGKKGLMNQETGKFTEGDMLFRKVTSTPEEKQDRLVKVGVKPIEKTVNISRPVEITVDENLTSGTQVVDQEGNDGIVTVKTIRNPKTGKIETSTEITTEAVAKKIRVGAQTTGKVVDTDEIPFAFTVKKDPSLKKGEYKIETEGKPGSITKTWTITNSVPGEPTEERVEPTNAVILVGDEDFTGTISHDVKEELPFTVKIVEDPTMYKGTHRVDQEGFKGSKTTTYSQKIKNGAAEGTITSRVDETKIVQPKEHIIRVGTKPLTGTTTVTSKNKKPFEVEIKYDETKPIGFVEETGGVTGEETKTTEVRAEDGTLTPGKTSTKEDKAPVKKIITVGTKDYTGEFTHEYTNTLPFETEVTIDPSLKANEIVEDQKGINGVTKTTVTQSFTNGTLGEKKVSEPIEVTKVQNRKIRIGAKTEGRHTYTEELPFTYEVKVNPQRQAGTYEIIKPGKAGSRTTDWTITNSVAGEGKVTAETPAENAIIEVGNKDFTGTFETVDKNPIPYEVEYKVDPNLNPGEEVVDQNGELGEESTTTTHAIKNGQVESSVKGEKVQTKAPVKKIVRIGAKTDGTYTHKEELPFDIKVEVDPSLNKGEYKVETPGKAGEKTTTVTIENSKVVGQPKVEEIKPTTQVVKVGSKDFVGEVNHEVTEDLGFETTIIEDNNLEAGTVTEDQAGKNGFKTTRYTQAIKNGQADGDLKSQIVKETKATNRILRVGTKPGTCPVPQDKTTTVNKEIPVDIEYVYDDTKEKGTVEKGESTPGKVETTLVSKMVDGKIVHVEETRVTNAKQKIIVGTKDFTGNFSYEDKDVLPYNTEVVYDETLEFGKIETVQDGENGETTKTVTQNFTNGTLGEKEVSEPKTTKEAKNKIIKIGVQPKVTEVEIKPDVDVSLNKDLKHGETRLIQEGQAGKVTITTFYNQDTGRVETKEEKKAPINKKIEMGTKTNGSYLIKGKVPFDVEIIYDNTMEAGTSKVEREGKEGLKETKISMENSEVTATEEKIVDQPVSKVIKVGTKPTEAMCKNPLPNPDGEKPEPPVKPDPAKPDNPVKPDPGKPDNPIKPDPAKPEKPMDPSPEKPAVPSEPSPGKPNIPGNSDSPKKDEPRLPEEPSSNRPKASEKPEVKEEFKGQPKEEKIEGKKEVKAKTSADSERPKDQGRVHESTQDDKLAPKTYDPGVGSYFGLAGLASVALGFLQRKKKED